MSGLDLDDDDDQGRRAPSGPLVVAVVSNTEDPDKLGRIKVTFPTIDGALESHWARVLRPAAGKGAESGTGPHGLYWPHEVGDEVVVGFLGDHPELPVVLGALWSKARPAPVPAGNLLDHRVVQSRAGHILRFDDTKDAEKLEIVAAKAKNAITLSTAEGAVTIAAETKLEIKVGADITLTLAEGEVTLTCKKLVVKDASDVSIAGGSIAVEADQGLTLAGGSGINLNDGALEVT